MKSPRPSTASLWPASTLDGLERLADTFSRHPLANLETYKYFNQKGEQADAARSAFLEAAENGAVPAAPEFGYPDIDLREMIGQRDELSRLLESVVELDMSVESVRILRESIANRAHEVGIMILTKLQSERSPTDPLYTALSQQLGQTMRGIYGEPNPRVWRRVLGSRLKKIADQLEGMTLPGDVADAWHYLLRRLPHDLPVQRSYAPRAATVDFYTEQLYRRMRPALSAVQAAIVRGEVVVSGGLMDARNIVAATKVALRARGFEGWQVKLTNEANIDTSQLDKTIYVPRGRRLDQQEFDAVIQSHEIDQHVARRENGDAHNNPLIGGIGCIGYLSWEEGNGKVNESLVNGTFNSEMVANGYYCSVGLALGFDGRSPGGRNFGETFELVWRLNLVEAYANAQGLLDEKRSKRHIMQDSFEHLRRIFRGTDGRVPGVVFTKDALTYYIGQTEVWHKWDRDMRLEEGQRLEEHRLERFAKIHPLRADHRRLTLGMFSA